MQTKEDVIDDLLEMDAEAFVIYGAAIEELRELWLKAEKYRTDEKVNH